MMLMPSADAFLTQLQETGRAWATFTPSDDLVLVVRSICTQCDILGLDVRIFLTGPDSLEVTVR